MSGRHLALLGAILFVALAITAALLDRTRQDSARVPEVSVAAPVIADPDPLARELERCQRIGEAGASDAACLAAWAENRRRFLDPESRASIGAPAASNSPATTIEEGR